MFQTALEKAWCGECNGGMPGHPHPLQPGCYKVKILIDLNSLDSSVYPHVPSRVPCM